MTRSLPHMALVMPVFVLSVALPATIAPAQPAQPTPPAASTRSPALNLRMERELAPQGVAQRRSTSSLNPSGLSMNSELPRGILFWRADDTTGDAKTITASGNVEVRAHTDTILADKITLQRDINTMFAQGHVRVRRQGSWVTGTALEYNRDQSTGVLLTPSYYLDDVGGRGQASELTFDGPQQYTVKDGLFTTCEAPRDDWFLAADTMHFDTQRQVGTAQGVMLRFMNVPLFYSPWLSFPLSSARRTGFLVPTYGTSNARGIELSLPFYWNIAPNYDMTLAPRFMGKRGLQMNGQFRYLFDSPLWMNGQIEAEFLPSDRVLDENRYLMSWKHQQGLLPWMNAYVDVTKVSDDTYFADLSDQISVTSQTTLAREAGVRLWRGPFSALVRVQNFQTLQDPDEPIAPPYNRTPQVNVTMSEWSSDLMRNYGLSLAAVAEYTRFRKKPNLPIVTDYEGERLVIQPTLTWEMNTPGWFGKAAATLRQTNYWLNDERMAQPLTVDKTTGTTNPIFSFDTGLIFERDTAFFGRAYTQTLEPRLYYVYAPYRNQDEQPVFDSAVNDFSFQQLFSDNRYLGFDRVGDANQLTGGLTSRLYSENGAEILRVFAGQRFYFDDQRVTLPGETMRSASRSDVLFGIEGQLSRAWRANMLAQHNFGSGQLEQFNAGLRWSPAPGKILSGSWRYTRQTRDVSAPELRQFDIAAQWPLSSRWDAVARWNYSIADSKTLEAIGALEYNADCWIFRVALHRLATTVEQTNTSLFLQLELNGLGRIGSSPLDILRRSLPGYTTSNDPSRRDSAPTYSIYPDY